MLENPLLISSAVLILGSVWKFYDEIKSAQPYEIYFFWIIGLVFLSGTYLLVSSFTEPKVNSVFGVSASLKGLIDGGLKELLGIIILYLVLTPCYAEYRRYAIRKSNENN
ncbi:hypothetical protein ACXHQ0_19315 [Vibrio antiquarius]|uniref:Uncharacterized protein n=1 Tax=Vibrio parahaemolyticus TaxID=670 RepID=A0AA46UR95_VIBPH|nr:hypothetical protein [Vibrio parahaemolyticus]UYV30387.1 hypothetical protein M5598_25605 [Vibrio parahaemolyticus]UYW19603.1 hypothetical protein IF561_25050 [Vibrio parahaemolyticus]WMN80574.1 hypothetical protein NI385_24510 [Vibrio parahaemolyticus]WMN81622.1 hypothetical protein NI385_30275 [Vibrio parahaemolyticus]